MAVRTALMFPIPCATRVHSTSGCKSGPSNVRFGSVATRAANVGNDLVEASGKGVGERPAAIQQAVT